MGAWRKRTYIFSRLRSSDAAAAQRHDVLGSSVTCPPASVDVPRKNTRNVPCLGEATYLAMEALMPD